jgi:hypothetical protein
MKNEIIKVPNTQQEVANTSKKMQPESLARNFTQATSFPETVTTLEAAWEDSDTEAGRADIERSIEVVNQIKGTQNLKTSFEATHTLTEAYGLRANMQRLIAERAINTVDTFDNLIRSLEIVMTEVQPPIKVVSSDNLNIYNFEELQTAIDQQLNIEFIPTALGIRAAYQRLRQER